MWYNYILFIKIIRKIIVIFNTLSIKNDKNYCANFLIRKFTDDYLLLMYEILVCYLCRKKEYYKLIK